MKTKMTKTMTSTICKKKVEKTATREDVFEQERKKVMKRSFEPQRRSGKLNLNAIGGDDDDDYGFGGRAAALRKNNPSLQLRFSRRKRLSKKLSFPKSSPFRNWPTAWPKKVPKSSKS